MYKIFNLFGFSDKFIEILIIKQPIIPGLDISELRKMAYVFSRVNDIEELVVNTAKIQGFKNYKRIFIRDYLKRICKWNKNISSNMYIASENEVYGSKYKFGFIYKGKEPVYLNCDDDVITFFETYELDKSKYSNLDDYLEKVSATEMRKLMLTGGVKHD